MKINDKIKNEYEEKYNENLEKIKSITNKLRIIQSNKFEWRFSNTMLFTALVYLVSIIILGILGSSIISPLIPANIIPYTVLAYSLGLGIIGENIYNKVVNNKEKFNEYFSNDTNKLEEEIRNEIELNITQNKNNIINKTIELLNDNKYKCSLLKQNKEETKNTIHQLKTLIDSAYKELNIETTKKVLIEKFCTIRDKSQKRNKTIITSIFSGIISVLLICLVGIFIKDIITFNIVGNLIIPFIIGSVTTSIYSIKNNKNTKKIFNKLNNELGNNSISYEVSKDDIKTLTEDKKIVNYISILKTELDKLEERYDKLVEEEKKANSTILNKEKENPILSDSPTLEKKLNNTKN